jgi:hypothetical protein
MKRKRLSVLIVLVVLVGWQLRRPHRAVPAAQHGFSPQVPAQARLQLAKPLAVPPPVAGLSPRCRHFQETLLSLDLSPLTTSSRISLSLDQPLTEPEAFAAKLPDFIERTDACPEIEANDPIRQVHSRLLAQCGAALPSGGSLADAEGLRHLMVCFHYLQRYRAALIEQRTDGIPLESIRDESTLLARLNAKTFGASGPDYEAMAQIYSRLEEIAPDKGYGLDSSRMRYDAVMTATDPAERARLRDALDSDIVDNREPDATEMRLLLARDRGDTEAMRNLAEQLRTSSSEKAEYYLAWADSLDNRADAAKGRLEAIAPSLPEAGVALRALADSDADARAAAFGDLGVGSVLVTR